jgi:hypothetical protein
LAVDIGYCQLPLAAVAVVVPLPALQLPLATSHQLDLQNAACIWYIASVSYFCIPLLATREILIHSPTGHSIESPWLCVWCAIAAALSCPALSRALLPFLRIQNAEPKPKHNVGLLNIALLFKQHSIILRLYMKAG